MGRSKRVRSFRLIFGFTFLLIVCTTMFASSSEQQHWMEVHSNHFVVLTDSDVKHGRDVAYRFEQMRYVFGAVMQKSAVNLPVPLQIIGFRSRAELLQYAPLYQGKPVDMAGFFEASPDRDFIALDLSTDNWSTALHEYTHALVHGNFPPVPAWFDEGLAEYFATLKITNNGLEIGNISDANRAALTNMPWMSLEELLLVQTNSDSYNQRQGRAIFYAQSWLLVHYLMSKQRLPDLFNYLQLTQIKQVPVTDAIQEAFGTTADDFEKALHDYAKGQLSVRRIQPLVLDFSGFPFNKVDLATANAEVADLHAHSRDYRQQAEGELKEVLRSDPQNAVANRSLAYLYIDNKDYEKAAECIRTAMTAAPKDAEPHYLAAVYMRDKAQSEGQRQQPGSAVAMERELETAIGLYQEYADAYDLLAYAYALEERYPQAISNAQKAVQLYPGNERYALDLAQYYADAGQFDKATAVLNRVKNSADPKVATAANNGLQSMQAKQSQYLQEKRANGMTAERYKQDLTSPQWRAAPGEKVASLDDLTAAANAQSQTDSVRPTKYLYAELMSVDCSSPPRATLNLNAGGKRLRLNAPDAKQVIVVGSDDTFSCEWRNRRVLVNYKAGGQSDGELLTLELK
jgi:tetratricopeptide (TPR) repeat protein